MWTTRALCAIAALSLAACSAAPSKPKGPAAVIEKGIFISTNDCAATGKLTSDECGAAIDSAIKIHEAQSKGYKTLNQCAAAVGKDRCDKSVDGRYRARLQAFFVVMSKPPQAEPLYPPAKMKIIGFRSPTQPTVDASDDNLIVSAAALTMAHENSRLP